MLPHCCYLVWGGYGLSNCVREGTGRTSTSASSHSHRIFTTASNVSCSSSGSLCCLKQQLLPNQLQVHQRQLQQMQLQ